MNTPESATETILPPSRTRIVLFALLAILILNGLILTCWGWEDWRGFFAHPARCAVVALLIFRFAHGIFTFHPNTFGRGLENKRVREGGFFILVIAIGLVTMASPWFDARDLWVLPGGDATRYAGLLLFVAGFALSIRAQLHLGRFFNGNLTLQEGHRLITDGPFTHIRHPRYAGLILLFLGLGLIFRSAAGASAGVACSILFLNRLPREEAMMAREFGAEWIAYVRRTKRLLPGLY